MILYFISILFFLNMALAEVGKISKIIGDNSAYLQRNRQNIPLSEELSIYQGDTIFSMNSVVLLYLRPTSQMSLAKNTQIKITQNLLEENIEKERTNSIIEFFKGIIRLQVTRDAQLEINQKVVAGGVSFAVRGTEFEVSKDGEDFDLDVVEGEVEVSSPYVQTFVPEIVRANEGFKFNKKNRRFQKRKFRKNFSDHPKFASKDEIRKKWKERRSNNKIKTIHKSMSVKKKLKSHRNNKTK